MTQTERKRFREALAAQVGGLIKTGSYKTAELVLQSLKGDKIDSTKIPSISNVVEKFMNNGLSDNCIRKTLDISSNSLRTIKGNITRKNRTVNTHGE